MNIAPIGVNTAQAVQPATKESFTLNIVTAPEHGQPADIVEISPRRANQSAMEQNSADKQAAISAAMLRRMAERLIKEQYEKGNHLYMLLYGNRAVQLDPSLRPASDIPEPTGDVQRQAVVSAGEYFGPAQTSGRILDTAKDIAGAEAAKPQPATVEAFRSAVKTAFDNVRVSFGGVMPDLTQRTYDATMQGFDTWAGTGE